MGGFPASGKHTALEGLGEKMTKNRRKFGAHFFRTIGWIPSGPGGLEVSSESSARRTFLVVKKGENVGPKETEG